MPLGRTPAAPPGPRQVPIQPPRLGDAVDPAYVGKPNIAVWNSCPKGVTSRWPRETAHSPAKGHFRTEVTSSFPEHPGDEIRGSCHRWEVVRGQDDQMQHGILHRTLDRRKISGKI